MSKSLNRECGGLMFVQKFVCSTIRPTQLPYKALYNYDAIAGFVAEYLSYEFLPVPTELVRAASIH